MRIVLTGTYNSANKGDAAMQQVFIAETLRRRPDTELILGSPFPEADARYHAPTRVVRSRRRNLPLATGHWLRLELMRLGRARPRHYLLDAEIDAMASADAIVDLSGDMLTEDYGPLVGYSHLLPLLQAQALGQPVVICAQSIGPFRMLAPLARRVLGRAHLVTVREPLSLELLAALKLPALAPVRTADLAFLLPPAPAARVREIESIESIPPRTRPRLGVSVSALLLNRSNRHLRTGKRDPIAVLATALNEATERLGAELLLVPHVFGPRPAADDRRAAESLAEHLRRTPLCLRGEYRPEELKGLIASCDAFVGCRMHANIAALDSGVPLLAIGYSHKTRGIMEDFGLGDRVLPIDRLEPERLCREIERLHTGRVDYRAHLAARLPGVRAAAASNIDRTLAVIDQAMQYRQTITGDAQR
jgi:colanic acid/amylovoran biosynthesis protein